jgi:capsular polysaccharide biosynthesis protein
MLATAQVKTDRIVPAAAVAAAAWRLAEAETYPRPGPPVANLEIVPERFARRIREKWHEPGQAAPEVVLYRLDDAVLFGQGNVCTADGRLVEESLFNLYPQQIEERIARMDALGADPPALRVDEPLVVLGRAGGANYGHWLVESLPLVPLIEASAAAAAEGLRPGAVRFAVNGTAAGAMAGVYRAALGAFGHGGDALFAHAGEPVHCRRLYIASAVSTHNHMKHPALIRGLEQLPGRLGVAPSSGARLYVGRPGGEKRRLVNADAVEPMFGERGFTVVHPGELSFADQVGLFAGAQAIAGISGAGLTNAVFAPRGTPMIWMGPAVGLELYFWDICCLKQQPYTAVFGEVSTAVRSIGGGHDDFAVDPDLVAAALAGLDNG